MNQEIIKITIIMVCFDFSGAKLNKSGITFARKIDKSPLPIYTFSVSFVLRCLSK